VPPCFSPPVRGLVQLTSEPSKTISWNWKHPVKNPWPRRRSWYIAYGRWKLSHEPKSSTVRTSFGARKAKETSVSGSIDARVVYDMLYNWLKVRYAQGECSEKGQWQLAVPLLASSRAEMLKPQRKHYGIFRIGKYSSKDGRCAREIWLA
jgi:hypothetical protein